VDVTSGRIESALTGAVAVTSMQFVPRSDTLVSVHEDGQIRLWVVREDGGLWTTLGTGARFAERVELSPDGRQLVAAVHYATSPERVTAIVVGRSGGSGRPTHGRRDTGRRAGRGPTGKRSGRGTDSGPKGDHGVDDHRCLIPLGSTGPAVRQSIQADRGSNPRRRIGRSLLALLDESDEAARAANNRCRPSS
jgi:hypothetical protein